MREDVWQRYQEAMAFLRFVFAHFLKDDCRKTAAALTYTTLFAVVPIMTVTFAIVSAIPSMQTVSQEIQDFVFRHFVPSTGVMVENYLHDFATQASKLTVVGIGILFFTAIMMMVAIEEAFNRIWRVKEPRKGIVSFLRYWAVLSLGPLLLGAGFAVSSYLTSIDILSNTANFVSNIIPGLRLIPLLFTALGFTLLYIAVPNCKVPLRAGIYGGVTAALLFEAAKRGFGVFVKNFSSYKLVYGAFAAFPIFLVWIYLSWVIILFGVELTRAFAVYRPQTMGHRHPVLTMLDLLQLFYRKYQTGGTVSAVEAMAVIGRHELEEWVEFERILLDQQLIRKTEEGDYVLCRNLEQLDFWDFYHTLPWPLPTPQDMTQVRAEDDWAAVLRPVIERVHHHLETEFRIPLSRILAGDTGAATVSLHAEPARDIFRRG